MLGAQPRSGLPKTHFRFDLQKKKKNLHFKLFVNTTSTQTQYFTFGPRSQKRRQPCADTEGTGTHPNTPSEFAVFGHVTLKQTK